MDLSHWMRQSVWKPWWQGRTVWVWRAERQIMHSLSEHVWVWLKKRILISREKAEIIDRRSWDFHLRRLKRRMVRRMGMEEERKRQVMMRRPRRVMEMEMNTKKAQRKVMRITKVLTIKAKRCPIMKEIEL